MHTSPRKINGLEKSDTSADKRCVILSCMYFTLTKPRRIRWTMVVARSSIGSETENVIELFH